MLYPARAAHAHAQYGQVAQMYAMPNSCACARGMGVDCIVGAGHDRRQVPPNTIQLHPQPYYVVPGAAGAGVSAAQPLKKLKTAQLDETKASLLLPVSAVKSSQRPSSRKVDENTWLAGCVKMNGWVPSATSVFEPITDNSLANMGTYQFQKMLKDAGLPDNITKEIKQIRKRMKNRVSAREHSQKQSTQMKELCNELHIKNKGLQTEQARVLEALKAAQTELGKFKSTFKELGEFIVKSTDFQNLSTETKAQLGAIVQKCVATESEGADADEDAAAGEDKLKGADKKKPAKAKMKRGAKEGKVAVEATNPPGAPPPPEAESKAKPESA